MESQQRGLVVVGRAAAAGGGVGPPTHPAGVAEFLQAVLHTAQAGEGLAGKGSAEFSAVGRPVSGQRSIASSISRSRSVRCRRVAGLFAINGRGDLQGGSRAASPTVSGEFMVGLAALDHPTRKLIGPGRVAGLFAINGRGA